MIHLNYKIISTIILVTCNQGRIERIYSLYTLSVTDHRIGMVAETNKKGAMIDHGKKSKMGV